MESAYVAADKLIAVDMEGFVVCFLMRRKDRKAKHNKKQIKNPEKASLDSLLQRSLLSFWRKVPSFLDESALRARLCK